MKKMKFKFLNMLLLLTLNGINVFGMNRETINETQKKMSIEDFLDEIYKNFTAIQEAFQNLNSNYDAIFYCSSYPISFYYLPVKNKSIRSVNKNIDNILIDDVLIDDVLDILVNIKEQIKNKKQFENKNPTGILITDILFKTYSKKEYNLNVFLEEMFFDMIIKATNYMLNYIINNDFFKKKWIDNKKDQCIQDDTIKVFTSILKYLETIKNFIINTSLKDKQLEVTLLTRVEDLKKKNQEARNKIEDLQERKVEKIIEVSKEERMVVQEKEK